MGTGIIIMMLVSMIGHISGIITILEKNKEIKTLKYEKSPEK